MTVLERVDGRITDLDSHEMIPTHMWGEKFGDIGATLAPLMEPRIATTGRNSLVWPMDGDVTEITGETVWTEKGPPAPGAVDMRRRVPVMDTMGVSRQLVFPGFGFVGIVFAANDDATVGAVFRLDMSTLDRAELGRQALRAHNDWVVETAKVDSRIRPVALVMTESLDAMMGEAERLIDSGVRALWIPSGTPPCGTSPADTRLDPFWQLAADADVPVVIHAGTGWSFTKSAMWGAVPQFSSDDSAIDSIEFSGLDPFHMSTAHFAEENFLAAMVLGGVFERNPTLRFGVIEAGASWLGPLAWRMDFWPEVFRSWSGALAMKPSEYLKRNVRVTPYWMEPVDVWIEQYGLEDVYAYSSDYPHVEGGKFSKERFADRLARLGEEVVEKFFSRNGELLLPA